jgi:hypothetical protein
MYFIKEVTGLKGFNTKTIRDVYGAKRAFCVLIIKFQFNLTATPFNTGNDEFFDDKLTLLHLLTSHKSLI